MGRASVDLAQPACVHASIGTESRWGVGPDLDPAPSIATQQAPQVVALETN